MTYAKPIVFLLAIVVGIQSKAQVQQSKFTYDVLFNTGIYTISNTEKARLDSLIQVLKKWSDFKLVLNGRTDDDGSDEENDILSQARVRTVCSYLMAQKIDTSKIKTKSFGEKNPLANNKDIFKKHLNRSVEIIMLRQNGERIVKVDDCLEINVPSRAFGNYYNDDIEFKVDVVNNSETLNNSNFTSLDNRGGQLASIGMSTLRVYNKGKDITNERREPLTVKMCSDISDTFALYCGELIKSRVVWTRTSAKTKRVTANGKTWYEYTVPTSCNYINADKPFNYGADLCVCADPFIANNLKGENKINLYDNNVSRSDRGVLLKADSSDDQPTLTVLDVNTCYNKMLLHASENINNTIAKQNVIVQVQNKSGSNFSGTIYFTRPATETVIIYKLYCLSTTDTLNPEWRFVSKLSQEIYKSKTCNMFSASVTRPGIYMLLTGTTEFDHNVRVKIKKMRKPSFWVLYKDRRDETAGQVYHTGEGKTIYTLEMVGEEKNTALVVYAFRKGQMYVANIPFNSIKYKKKRDYYILKKKDFELYDNRSAKRIGKFAARYN